VTTGVFSLVLVLILIFFVGRMLGLW